MSESDSTLVFFFAGPGFLVGGSGGPSLSSSSSLAFFLLAADLLVLVVFDFRFCHSIGEQSSLVSSLVGRHHRVPSKSSHLVAAVVCQIFLFF